jgi:TATA-binding protein-associated factor
LIGLKYVFASIPQGEQVKMDMLAQKLLPSALPRLILALKDDDDDVRAAAAEAALPARESLNPQLLRKEKENDESDDDGNLFKVFLETLWNALLELDDLSPSARPIMSLLAKLCEKKETRDMFNVAEVAPRLWPFAAHPIASVREATWQTVSELSGTLLENESFVDVHLADYMTLALQGCALDEDDNASLAAKKAFLLVLELSGFDVGSNSSSSDSKNVALEAVKNTRRIIRLKVAEIFKVKSDAFLKVLSVQVNRTCDAHYILVKKPAKMTGEARNVAADWLCRTKTRFLGIECVAKALVSLLPTSSSSSSEYAEEEETLTLFLNDKVMALSKHGTAAARGAAFHVCANFLETAAKAASIQNTSFEFIEKKFKPLYETRVFEVLACANPAYPSAPSPFPYDEAKALQTYVKNETKSLLRVCLQSNVAIEGEIPSPDADGFGAANAVQVMETVPKVCFVLLFLFLLRRRLCLLFF